jgi:hypothetical protein
MKEQKSDVTELKYSKATIEYCLKDLIHEMYHQLNQNGLVYASASLIDAIDARKNKILANLK